MDASIASFQKKYQQQGLTKQTIASFRYIINEFFKEQGRDLPWRKTSDPYHILISEVMLQQTQVSRTLDAYFKFLRAFPDIRSLADARIKKIVSVWQGMGYNRRALLLKKCASIIVEKYNGRIPREPADLEALPGIGPATAASICAFAFNAPVVFIETNIRTVYLHFFFPDRKNVSDAQLEPLVRRTLDPINPRAWYSALMDYGALLKRTIPNPSRRSAHHVRQSAFEGSTRQVRGAVLKLLLQQPCTQRELSKKIGTSMEKLKKILFKLQQEGLIERSSGRFRIPL